MAQCSVPLACKMCVYDRQGSDYDGRCLPGTRTPSCSSGTGEVLNFEQGSDLIAGLRDKRSPRGQESTKEAGAVRGRWARVPGAGEVFCLFTHSTKDQVPE